MTDSPPPQEDKKPNGAPELDLAETVYVRDIENRVFQAIVVQALAPIPGISLLEGGLIDSFLGRGGRESIKGIHAEQDPSDHSISVRVEVKVAYGICIPEKAEEIQERISQELSNLTGLHVNKVHVVFKDIVMEDPERLLISTDDELDESPPLITEAIDGE
jgi:uncharacterized alkaline shock family protein YloU